MILIGSHTNKLLNQQGYETLVYDNLIYGHKEAVKWGEFILTLKWSPKYTAIDDIIQSAWSWHLKLNKDFKND